MPNFGYAYHRYSYIDPSPGMNMNLSGKLCAIREWSPDDVDALARLADNRAIWRNMRDRFPHPYTVEDAESWIRRCEEKGFSNPSYPIEVDGDFAGVIGSILLDDVHRHTVEVGYWLGEPYWGRGIATEALLLYSEYVLNVENKVRLEAHVFEWNPASCRVLEKAGFELEGCMKKSVYKDGEFIDAFLYAKVAP